MYKDQHHVVKVYQSEKQSDSSLGVHSVISKALPNKMQVLNWKIIIIPLTESG